MPAIHNQGATPPLQPAYQTNYLPSLIIFLFMLGMNLSGIAILFSGQITLWIVDSLLVLECLVIAGYHHQCGNSQSCPAVIKSCINHFKYVFIVLSISSMFIFGLDTLENHEWFFKKLRLFFYLLFAALTFIGARLAMETWDHEDTPTEHDAPTSHYGKAGYQTKEN